MLKRCSQVAGLNKMRSGLNSVNPTWTTALSALWRKYSTNTRMKPQFPYPSPGSMRRHQINRHRGGTNGGGGPGTGGTGTGTGTATTTGTGTGTGSGSGSGSATAAAAAASSVAGTPPAPTRTWPVSARSAIDRPRSVAVGIPQDSDSDDISAASSRADIAEEETASVLDKPRRKSAWKSWRTTTTTNSKTKTAVKTTTTTTTGTRSRGQEMWNTALTAARERNRHRYHADDGEEEEPELPEHEPGPFKLMPPLKPVKTLNFLYQQSILNGNGVPSNRPYDYSEDDRLDLDDDLDLEKIDSVSALERVRKERERRRAQKKMLDLMQQQFEKDQLQQEQKDQWNSEDQMRMASLGGEPPRRSRSDEEKHLTQLMIAQEPRQNPSQADPVDPSPKTAAKTAIAEVPEAERPSPLASLAQNTSLPPIPDARNFRAARDAMPRQFIPLSPTATAIKDLDYSRQFNVLQLPPRSGLEQGEPPEVMRSLRRIRSLARLGRDVRFKTRPDKEDPEEKFRSPPLTEQPPRSRGPLNSVMDVHKARAMEMEKRRLQDAGSKESATSYLYSQMFEKSSR
ncbi:hypothetical protein KR067_007813 [Drosophila pandora]|nr:hypothetical protein KR067_007813 [Drosophila pandora]